MIRLHYLEGCPFCVRVQDKLDKMKLVYELVDAEADNFAEVLQIAEYDMVPVLVDGNRVIQDSHLIINYLKKTYGKGD